MGLESKKNVEVKQESLHNNSSLPKIDEKIKNEILGREPLPKINSAELEKLNTQKKFNEDLIQFIVD